jgi:hypothetical protein
VSQTLARVKNLINKLFKKRKILRYILNLGGYGVNEADLDAEAHSINDLDHKICILPSSIFHLSSFSFQLSWLARIPSKHYVSDFDLHIHHGHRLRVRHSNLIS